MPHPYPQPAFKSYACSARIDFATITRSEGLPVSELRALGAKVPPFPKKPLVFGQLATMHDPKPALIEKLIALSPGAILSELEVALDFRPNHFLGEVDLQRQLRTMFEYLVTRIVPWGGPGLQPAARISRGRSHSEALIDHSWAPFSNKDIIVSASLPKVDETVYFGHRDQRWTNSALSQYAYVRVYVKRNDNRTPLPLSKWRVRMEVNLNRDGCGYFGLTTLADLAEFRFRRLGDYFHLAEPAVIGSLPKRTQKAHPWLEAAMRRATAAATRHLHEYGAYLAVATPGARTGRGFTCRTGNRKIGALLDGLSSSFARQSGIRKA